MEITFFLVLVKVKTILQHCEEFPPKQLTRHIFRETNVSKTTKDSQQNYEMLAQKENQRSVTGLSQTKPRFPLMIIVVKDQFA